VQLAPRGTWKKTVTGHFLVVDVQMRKGDYVAILYRLHGGKSKNVHGILEMADAEGVLCADGNVSFPSNTYAKIALSASRKQLDI
jgi:hypothetical protein